MGRQGIGSRCGEACWEEAEVTMAMGGDAGGGLGVEEEM